MMRLQRKIRASLFYLLCAVSTLIFSLPSAIIWCLPIHQRFVYISWWTYLTLWLLKVLCGIDYRIHGRENLPGHGPFVVLAKHQSAWETFLLLMLLKPVSIILKQELLKIPAFGWGLATIKPIAIDRSNPKKAIRQIRETGLMRLRQNHMPVLIFPEGTRIAAGQTGKYARGGAALAMEAGVPVVFIAHNAGYFWPSGQMPQRPGTIDLYISKPVNSTDYDNPRTLTAEAQAWIEAHVFEPRDGQGL